MTSMKAVRIHSYGDRDVLTYEDAPRPTPGPGEALIRVYATSVNPFDCYVHMGYMTAYFNYTLPLIPGSDAAGVIEEVGEGVTDFQPGDEVYARAGVWRDGANAEYVVAAAADIAAKPQSLDFVHAAALPHAVLTAWQALIEGAQLEAGQTVLIHAAAGGVGHVAVQLAKERGATVIGTTSQHTNLVRALGADEIIDYSTTAFEDAVRDSVGAVDVVLDLVGGETQARSWAVIKPGGILISAVQPPSEEEAQAHGVRCYYVASAPPIGATLAEVAKLVDSGKIRPVVSAVLPLADIRQAHELVESHHTAGKVVLQVVP
jgi:NADPH:quinone reductase-like Zn-dependent oxidoreductase